jgi:ankyrin repeat protein
MKENNKVYKYKIKDYSLKIWNKINNITTSNQNQNIKLLCKYLTNLKSNVPHKLNWNCDNYLCLTVFIQRIIYLKEPNENTFRQIYKIIKLLLEQGSNPNHKILNQNFLFNLISSNFPFKFCYYLLKLAMQYNWDFNQKVPIKNNILTSLRDDDDQYNLLMFKLLLKKKIILNSGSLFFFKNHKIVKLLLEYGLDPNVKNYQEDIPLHLLFYNNKPKQDLLSTLNVYLQYNTNIRHTNIFSQNIIQTIVQDNIDNIHPQLFDCISLLLIKGLKINYFDKYKNTVLFYVNFNNYISYDLQSIKKFENNYIKLYKFLVQKGVNLNHKNYLGNTFAFNNKFTPKIFKKLIKLGLNVNILNNEKQNILTYYINNFNYLFFNQSNFYQLIKIFCQNNFKLNSQDKNGNTLMHFILRDDLLNNINSFYYLYKKGANVTLKNKYDRSPLNMLNSIEYFELLCLAFREFDRKFINQLLLNLNQKDFNNLKKLMQIMDGIFLLNLINDFIKCEKNEIIFQLENKGYTKDVVKYIICNLIYPS